MNQDEIRKDLKEYLKNNGVKSKFIALKLELSPAMISYFINNKKGLSSNYLQQICRIIYS